MAEPFIAEIQIFAFNFPPRFWAQCDGQLIAVSQNTALFSLVGTTYGGNGRTSFGLPNLEGRAPMHWGHGAGLTPRGFGEYGGSPRISLDLSEIPSHTHQLTGLNTPGDSGEPKNRFLAYDTAKSAKIRNLKTYQPNLNYTTMSPLALTTAGLSQGHENRQPYLTLSFCIALLGTYPSRN